MPTFKCINSNCTNYNKTELVGVGTYTIVDGALKAKERFCKKCKKEMEELVIPNDLPDVKFTTFNNFMKRS